MQEYVVLERGSACLPCKKRKKRCDAVKPICGPCRRVGTADQCAYPAPPASSHSSSPSAATNARTKVRATPPRKGDILRNQIRELEEQIASLQRRAADRYSGGTRSGGEDDLDIPRTRAAKRETRSMSPLGLRSNLSDPPFSGNIATPTAASPPYVDDSESLWGSELIDAFIQHRHLLAFHVDESRFISIRQQAAFAFSAHPSGRTSPEDSTKVAQSPPHLSLLYVIFLLGLHYLQLANPQAATKYSRYESVFLQRARAGLEESLASATELDDFLSANTLLIWWYFLKGRLSEAVYHTSGLTCFANASQLHATLGAAPSFSNTRSYQAPPFILSPPEDLATSAERAALFWSIFLLDRYTALLCGVPSVLSDSNIGNCWPGDRDRAADFSRAFRAGSSPLDLPPKNDECQRLVGVWLLERTTRLRNNVDAMIDSATDGPHLVNEYTSLCEVLQSVEGWLARSALDPVSAVPHHVSASHPFTSVSTPTLPYPSVDHSASSADHYNALALMNTPMFGQPPQPQSTYNFSYSHSSASTPPFAPSSTPSFGSSSVHSTPSTYSSYGGFNTLSSSVYDTISPSNDTATHSMYNGAYPYLQHPPQQSNPFSSPSSHHLNPGFSHVQSHLHTSPPFSFLPIDHQAISPAQNHSSPDSSSYPPSFSQSSQTDSDVQMLPASDSPTSTSDSAPTYPFASFAPSNQGQGMTKSDALSPSSTFAYSALQASYIHLYAIKPRLPHSSSLIVSRRGTILATRPGLHHQSSSAPPASSGYNRTPSPPSPFASHNAPVWGQWTAGAVADGLISPETLQHAPGIDPSAMNVAENDAAVQAASAVAELARGVLDRGARLEDMDMMIGLTWVIAGNVLKDELARFDGASGGYNHANSPHHIRAQLDLLDRAVDSLARTFPLTSTMHARANAQRTMH